MIEGFRQFIDTRRIDGDALVQFRKLALTTVSESAPVFGEWLRGWLETEEYWRATDPDNRPRQHVVALPPASTWTDRELGQSLRAITVLSLIPMHGSLDQFLDRLTAAISERAADRLEKHGG